MQESDLQWSVQQRKVSDLKDYKKNPRYITKSQFSHLKRSFQKFNYVEYVVVQPDNRIIAGHQRIHAMRQLGWKDRLIPVIVPNRMLTEEEMDEYLIRSNKNHGEWDFEKLANEWDLVMLHDCGFEADDLGIITEQMEETNKDLNDECKKCPTCGQKLRKKK